MKPLSALVCVLVFAGSAASAQTVGATGGKAAAELALGYAGFVDDAMIQHGVVGGAVRWHLTPRLSVGPELTYMRGPGDDRDLMLTGNVTFDLVSPSSRRVVPFVVAGAGLFRHSDRIGPSPYSSSEGAFTAGGGVRTFVDDRWYLGVEARAGWELHTRVGVVIGHRF